MATSKIEQRLVVERGNIQITPSAANTPTKGSVTFTKTFSEIPTVIPIMQTSVPGTVVVGISVGEVRLTGCDFWVTRSNTTQTSVPYVVIGI